MVARQRKIGGKRHVLSDHSLSKGDAVRIARRHRQLGLNARVVQHSKDGWAVYRRCNLRKKVVPTNNKRKVHVNQLMIRQNIRNPGNPKPPITIQTSKGSIRATEIELEGDSKLIYNNQNPLSCGARLWIETDGVIKIDDCTRLG